MIDTQSQGVQPSDLWLEEHWLETHVRKRYPELVRPLMDAMKTFSRVSRKRLVALDALTPLIAAATNDRAPLRDAATGMLGRLAEAHEAARQAMMNMATDANWQVRFNAVLCVNEQAPRSFSLTIIRQGLCDKSWRVREKAADWALRCHFIELLPDLREARKQESNQSARACMEYAIESLVRERTAGNRKRSRVAV
jgi:HEAT repeat protein